MNKGEELANKYKARISRNMDQAAIFFCNKVKVNLNSTTEYRKAGERRLATTKNTPPNYPRKLTGFLQKSIAWNKVAWNTVKAGSAYIVAKFLHAMGYDFIPRTFHENKTAIKRIILRP